MTDKTDTVETVEDKKLGERAAFLYKQVSNKLKRQAVAYFDKPLDDFDELDNMVLLCAVADNSRSIEEYDELPLSSLTEIIMAEAE